jgi:hypothetical protein
MAADEEVVKSEEVDRMPVARRAGTAEREEVARLISLYLYLIDLY